MSNNLRYPLIMQPGKLRELNDYVISKLHVPVFFATPEPARPHAKDPCGLLYEIITGLYIIYHDYGIRFMEKYLVFVKEQFLLPGADSLFSHYLSANKLRGGFCHGSLPQGIEGIKIMNKVDFYFPGAKEQPWPGMLPTMTEQQCSKMVNALTYHSDRLYAAIKESADIIAANPDLLSDLKNKIFENVINKNVPKYGDHFFDGRIVSDIEPICRGGKEQKLYQAQLQRWLANVQDAIRNGTLRDSDYLQESLMSALRDLYHPQFSIDQESSADILWPL